MKKISIKLKVTLWYSVVMIILSSVVIGIMAMQGSDIIRRDAEMKMIRVVTEFSRRMMIERVKTHRIPHFAMFEQGVHMVVCDKDGNIVEGELPFDFSTDVRLVEEVLSYKYNGEKFYVYNKKVHHKGADEIWVRGIMPFANEEFFIKSAIKTNIILALFLTLIASLGGYFIISRAFIPVNKIRQTAQKISNSNDFSKRIMLGEGRDEIHSLADTFDEMLDKIEQAFEREKQFTSDASHELRTPVSVILSECEYMLDCAKAKEEYTESAESIKRQTEKMSKLISELLMISRMDKDTLQINFETVDVSELLSFVCDEQEEIHKENIQLIRNIKPGVTAKADTFLLARLLINLISNAYSYSKDTGTVTVTLDDDNENIVISVLDEGIGIAPENIPKIWERFYQVDPSRSNDGNLGLGLSMVKWIAECHGGSIKVESELGEGSNFIFTFSKISN